MEVIVKEHQMSEPGTLGWFIDPRHRRKTIRALRKTTDGWRNGLSVRGQTGDWHSLVSLNIAGAVFRSHEGEVQHIRLHAANTLVDFGTPLLCPPTSLYAVFDRLVDGMVVRADEVPLVAFGGPGLRGIPKGLRYLSTSPGMSPDVLRAIVASDASRELIGIDLTGCDSLTDLERISGLSNLTTLRITRCANLENIEALGSLRQLRTLVLSQCHALRSVEVIGTLVRLKALQVSWVPFDPTLLRAISSLERLSLKMVDLQEQEAQGRVLPLDRLPMLRELDLFNTNWPSNAEALLCLPRLRSLRLGHNRRIRSVAPLVRLEELQELCVSGCDGIGDLDELARAPSLRKLGHYDLAAAARIIARCSARRGDLPRRHTPTFDWCVSWPR